MFKDHGGVNDVGADTMNALLAFGLPEAVVCLAMLGFIGGGIAYYVALCLHNPKNSLRKWAAEHGLELLESEYRVFRRGPFKFGSKVAVYRIATRDDSGHVRKAYAEVGGSWGFSDYVNVLWDEEPPDDDDPSNGSVPIGAVESNSHARR